MFFIFSFMIAALVFRARVNEDFHIASSSILRHFYKPNGDLEMGSLTNGNAPRFHQESAPLASAREEEWGWEEGGFDNVSKPANDQLREQDDLQLALAMSLSSQSKIKTNSNNSLVDENAIQNGSSISTTTTVKPSPPMPKSKFSPPIIGLKSKTAISDSNSNNNKSIAIPKSSPPIGGARSVTSKKSTVLPPSTPHQQQLQSKQDDDVEDIFATMGFSAKSNISQPTVTPQQQKTTSLLAADDNSSLGSASNWDDDEDLDDLLDD